MSTCDAFQADLSALLDEALAPDEAAALEEHLAGCEACQAEREALASVVEQVSGLERIGAPPEFTAQLWARVQADDAQAPAQATVLVAKAVRAPAANAPVLPAAEPNPCQAFHEDVSALLDRALLGPRESQVRAHLAECPACTELGIDLQRVRDRVGGLTPLRVPPEFVGAIMDRVEAIEREQVEADRAARAARATWLVRLGKVAQAAAILFVVGGGVMFAAPRDPYRRSLPGFSSPSASAQARARHRAHSRLDESKQVDQTPEPLPSGDAEWELAVTSVEEGQKATRRLLSAYARDLRQRPGERSYGFYAQVPRNQVDDLHRGLTAEQSVQTSPSSEQAMQAIHAEQDQVVLKSGFVLVGQLLDQGRVVRLRSGDATVHAIAGKDVERVERAAETRSLRILLHQRD